jgi:hypothetical protein
MSRYITPAIIRWTHRHSVVHESRLSRGRFGVVALFSLAIECAPKAAEPSAPSRGQPSSAPSETAKHQTAWYCTSSEHVSTLSRPTSACKPSLDDCESIRNELMVLTKMTPCIATSRMFCLNVANRDSEAVSYPPSVRKCYPTHNDCEYWRRRFPELLPGLTRVTSGCGEHHN